MNNDAYKYILGLKLNILEPYVLSLLRLRETLLAHLSLLHLSRKWLNCVTEHLGTYKVPQLIITILHSVMCLLRRASS